MSITASATPFKPDRRANRLEDWRLEQVGREWFVLLRGANETAKHVVAGIPGAQLVDRRPHHAPYWSHRVHLAGPPPLALRELLLLLQRILTLCVRDEVDGAVALDFYKRPSEADPERLADTETGELVQVIKNYGRRADREIRMAGPRLVSLMCDVVVRHPWLRSATHVLPVPGHDQRGPASASVQLGHTVGRNLDLELIRVGTRTAFRLSAKDIRPEDRPMLLDEFDVDADLTGRTVLIVDDVYHTGYTMAGVARAARHAGATTVLGIVAARNVRLG